MPRPRVNRALPLALHELPAATLEELTCALVDKEQGIVRADLFRPTRQAQFGIDVLAERANSDIEVTSCKCYSKLRKGELGRFSDDFLKHWDSHWKIRNVRRFILAVTADVTSVQREAEIETERQRFAELGVRYEVWGPRQLQERLRTQPGIVAQYVGPEHVGNVCGFATSQPVSAAPALAG